MKKLYILLILAAFIVLPQINAKEINSAPKTTATTTQQTPAEENYKEVKALDLVNHPDRYMNKLVKINAKFDKFATLGLDYPPVKRDEKTHISFLIKRDDVKDYNIPLSELKLILKRDYAEKELIKLETNDEIEIYGKVFSNALGDPWVDVSRVKILTVKEAKKDK